MKYSNSRLYGSEIVNIEIAPDDVKLIDFLNESGKIFWKGVLVDVNVTNAKGETKTYFMWEFNETDSLDEDYWKDHFLTDNQYDNDLSVLK